MNELGKRALTGAAYVALTLGAAWSGVHLTLVLFLPVCAMAAAEWDRLFRPGTSDRRTRTWAVLLAMIGYLAVAAIPLPAAHVGWPLAAAIMLSITTVGLFLALGRGVPSPASELAAFVTTLVYIALPFGIITHFMFDGPYRFIGFMLLLWTSDTGAYLVGRAIGRTPLMLLVSPKKTVEGLAGGVLLTMAAGWALARAWPLMTTAQWMACAALVAIMATLGDLVESAFKRAAGVKDSGHVLPGHGGILDRFDGFLLAAPAMLLAMELMRA